MTYQSTNPASGKVLQTFEEISDTELESKLAAAAPCYETWRLKPYAKRAVIIARVGVLMHEKVEELAHIMTPMRMSSWPCNRQRLR